MSTEIMAPVDGESAEPAPYKLYGALPPRRVSRWRALYSRRTPPEWRQRSGEAWLHIDDETVRAVGHVDVFGDHGNEREDDRCVYWQIYHQGRR